MSREYKGRKIVVYPQYIDSTKTRSEGRRIPRNLAIPHPRMDEIIKAADLLNLNPIVEEDKRYPRNWWEHSGRIIVDKRRSKINTLKLLAKKIRELRK